MDSQASSSHPTRLTVRFGCRVVQDATGEFVVEVAVKLDPTS